MNCKDNISMNVAPFPEKHAKLMSSVIAPNMILQVYLEPNVASTAVAKPCELRGSGHDAHGLATFPRLLSVAVEQHGSPARGLPIQQMSQIIVWWHSA
ncbi:hypothetical protein DPMN_185955 [Dreissena polymorpha]|uniref:Uncharacterized protein n=1 Tax=Dreissena polymorpha TaxID=45954 RepID=A0A9D4DPL0_DREPO|nr:hypothetical protein DPMN_185955 [Dreissena polymorpha]